MSTKKRIVTIHNGKITIKAEGYKGNTCETPLNQIIEKLGGKIKKEIVTEEGQLPNDPIQTACEEESFA